MAPGFKNIVTEHSMTSIGALDQYSRLKYHDWRCAEIQDENCLDPTLGSVHNFEVQHPMGHGLLFSYILIQVTSNFSLRDFH